MKSMAAMAALAALAGLFTAAAGGEEKGAETSVITRHQVTLSSLLGEMIDRATLARWPEPAYTCKQFSSHDRESVSADQPGWFANHDPANYVRTEDHKGRTEYV